MLVKLGDICNILNGFAFKSENYVNSGIRVIRIQNVQKGFVEDNNPAFYPADTKGLDKYLLENNDLLISLTGNVGRVAILEKNMLPAALNQRVACLRLKSNNITKRYLFHYLNSNRFEQNCIHASNGIAQKNLSTEWLKDYEISLHNIKEQNTISNILDSVSHIISLRNQQLEQLDLLIKSRFVEMFGDPVKNEKGWKIKEIQSVSKVGSSKRFYQEELSVSGVPFLRIADILNKIDNKENEANSYISEEQYFELLKQNLVPKENDVLITSRGTIGKCYIISKYDRFYFQDGMITWLSNFDQYLSSKFLYYSFEMDGIRKQIDRMQAGSTVAYLSIAMIKKLNIIIPPIALQNQFAAFVEEVEKEKATVKQSLEWLNTLKAKLMQDYFG